jgi:hypothetical protein
MAAGGGRLKKAMIAGVALGILSGVGTSMIPQSKTSDNSAAFVIRSMCKEDFEYVQAHQQNEENIDAFVNGLAKLQNKPNILIDHHLSKCGRPVDDALTQYLDLVSEKKRQSPEKTDLSERVLLAKKIVAAHERYLNAPAVLEKKRSDKSQGVTGRSWRITPPQFFSASLIYNLNRLSFRIADSTHSFLGRMTDGLQTADSDTTELSPRPGTLRAFNAGVMSSPGP